MKPPRCLQDSRVSRLIPSFLIIARLAVAAAAAAEAAAPASVWLGWVFVW